MLFRNESFKSSYGHLCGKVCEQFNMVWPHFKTERQITHALEQKKYNGKKIVASLLSQRKKYNGKKIVATLLS